MSDFTLRDLFAAAHIVGRASHVEGVITSKRGAVERAIKAYQVADAMVMVREKGLTAYCKLCRGTGEIARQIARTTSSAPSGIFTTTVNLPDECKACGGYGVVPISSPDASEDKV